MNDPISAAYRTATAHLRRAADHERAIAEHTRASIDHARRARVLREFALAGEAERDETYAEPGSPEWDQFWSDYK